MLVLWRGWLEIAADHASLAIACRAVPSVVDAISRSLHGEETYPPPGDSGTAGSEAAAALIAITAAAFANRRLLRHGPDG